jgi:prepilin-type processing-associated H-X9-DG protein
VLLLPATDHPGAYRAYRFEEPWNSARNRSVEVFNVYYDGTDETSEENHWTSYVAVVGDETMWPIEGGLKQTDVSDGLSQTIILVQVAESGIHWREPKDLHLNRMAKEINSKTTKGISSKHAGGAYVAFADGRVRFLSDNTDWRVLKALLTANGGEPLDASFRPRRKPRGSTTQDD